MEPESGGITPEYAEIFGLEAEDAEITEEAEETGLTDGEEEEEEADGEDTAETADAPAPAPLRQPERQTEPDQRTAERQREEADRRNAEQLRRDRIYAELFAGQRSPYTGRPITTEAEFRAYQAEKERRAAEQELQQAGIQPETIRGIVDRQLEPMRQLLLSAQIQAARERARAADRQAGEVIDAAVRSISAVWPEIKSLEDIAALPTAGEFNRLVQLGNSLEDAFYLANRKEIEARKIAAAKTAAVYGAAGKRHLDPAGGGGSGEAVEVPAELREAYREMMPGATDAEITDAYRKYLKDMKKGR